MNESIFEATCGQLDPEAMDIRLDRTGQTIEALVLDYFFEKNGEDTYSLKPDFLEEYLHFILVEDLRPSDALEHVIMTNDLDFSDDVASKYKYGDYTEDPGELDEQIDEYLFEKYMEED
jgi:hypothetical protein